MKAILKQDAIVFILGPGGVGKTTVAAALAVGAALRRFETGVITVDPSRRLRDALGRERLSAKPTRLDPRRLKAAGLDSALPLAAAVLDVKRAWDGLVRRSVGSPAARRRIFANSFYQSLAGQFAGAEAYATLEQVYELYSTERFAVTIVDTPPAAHAFEFIQAPAHLLRLLDLRAARWLWSSTGTPLTGLASRAARFVASQLEHFAGTATLAAAAQFFADTAGAGDAIVARFRAADALLHSPAVHFVLVTTAEDDRLREAQGLIAQMKVEGLKLDAIVLNRLVDERTFASLAAAPRRTPPHLLKIQTLNQLARAGLLERQLLKLTDFFASYSDQQRAAIARAMRFARELPPRVELVVMPEIASGVRDLEDLKNLGHLLCEVGAGRKFVTDAAVTLAVHDRMAPADRWGAP